eukprot:1157446-Pelagomonas_calceolata.AAC.9
MHASKRDLGSSCAAEDENRRLQLPDDITRARQCLMENCMCQCFCARFEDQIDAAYGLLSSIRDHGIAPWAHSLFQDRKPRTVEGNDSLDTPYLLCWGTSLVAVVSTVDPVAGTPGQGQQSHREACHHRRTKKHAARVLNHAGDCHRASTAVAQVPSSTCH